MERCNIIIKSPYGKYLRCRSKMTPSLQPNSRHCFVCGLANPFGLKLRFYQTNENEVTAQYTAPEHYQGYPGVVHGGIVAAMLDEAAGRPYMGEDPPRFMVTARLEIRYRKNVPVGKPLRLVGRAVTSKGRSATAVSLIYDAEGNLLAEAEALLVNVPESVLDVATVEELGWKVYPEEVGERN
jgi:acyl-coenzyme A thioesterase PaaI-like protein